jgi:hypothetical protein
LGKTPQKKYKLIASLSPELLTHEHDGMDVIAKEIRRSGEC